MRQRGAKVTDIIVVVISTVEGIQQQTKEVINLARWYGIPIVIALNKCDRQEANPDDVILNLGNLGLETEDVGGTVPTAKISAFTGKGLDELEQKIVKISEQMNLFEDNECLAQCFIVETNLEPLTNIINVSLVVKKGVLNLDQLFVCGTAEGKIKQILNDKGQRISKAIPGQAVTVTGFKSLPDVG